MELKQFNHMSSWRQDEITIAPHETYTLTFRDTTPNVFIVNNPNEAVLKISIGALPRTDSFEFKVEYNSVETIGQPHGTAYLYLLNDTDREAKVKVFSIETIFNPEILKNMNVTLEGYNIITNTEISGFKEGASLPSGTNNIGKVEMSNNEWTSAKIEEFLNAVKNVKINTEGASFDMSGTTIETAWTETDVLNVLNKLQALVEKENVESWTVSDVSFLKEYIDTLCGYELLTSTNTTGINTVVKDVQDKLTAGKLSSKVLTPNAGTDVSISPDSGYTYFDSIQYMRAIGGDFTFKLKGASSDTSSSLPALTLADGDCFNDFKGKCYGIIVNSAKAGAKLEIVYSQK